MNQRLWFLMISVLLLAGCSAKIMIATPAVSNPSPVAAVRSSGPKPGYWEGERPTVSFDITPDGKLRNFKLVGSMPLGSCTITFEEIQLGQAGDFEIGTSNDSSNHITGKLNGPTTFAGTYKIKVCKGLGDQYTVVLSPEDKPWQAAWKGEAAGQGESAGQGQATAAAARPTLPPPPTAPTLTPTPKPSTSAPPSGSWQRITTLPRQINSFAVDPTNPRILYAGTGDSGSGSGVYKSEDAGQAWKLAAAGLPSEDVSALAVSRAAPTTLYAMVGVRGYVYASSDGAQSWTRIGDSALFGGYTRKLIPVPGKSQTLFSVALGSGLARSNDGGHTWTPVRKGLPGDERNVNVQSLAIDPADTNVLYLGTGGFVGGGHGVFKSTDGGENWTASNEGMIDYRITAVAVDPAHSKTAYAGSDAGEFFKSTDGGQTWKELTDKLPMPKNQHIGIRQILIDPTSAGTVYLLCDQVGVLVSADGGVDWNQLGKPTGENYYTFTAMTVLSGPKPVILLGVERAGAWRYAAD